MKRIIDCLIVGLINLLLNSVVSAENLLDIYQDALNYDAVFQSAYTALLSAREDIPIARAALLPDITLFGTRVQEDRNAPAPTSFPSNVYSIELTQPVYNLTSWVRLSQAKASVKQAQAIFDAAALDLMIRTATAYFGVLEAQDNLRFFVAEKKANERQLEQAKQRYKVGLDAVTSVYDAQASYDAVVAQVIEAENEVQRTKEVLHVITGKFYPKLAGIAGEVPLVMPNPQNRSAWGNIAIKQNFEVKAQEFATQIAKKSIDLNFSDFVPTVNAVASYSDRTAANLFGSTGGAIYSRTVGVEVAVSPVQGGGVFFRVRKAKRDYETALAQLDDVRRVINATARQTYNNIVSGISKIRADRQAVISAQSSVDSSEAAFKVGTRTIVDVLDAQKDLYEAQRNLARDVYAYINNILLLKQAAGSLGLTDLQQINAWLVRY